MRIEVCGNIASGKTTLALALQNKRNRSIFENFQSNPFYEDFYQNPNKFSFETELTFLLQHFHSIKIQSQNSNLICDYSLLQDLAYADTNLAENRLKIFNEVYHELLDEIGFPKLIIHLVCPEKILLERIIARSRSAETSITIEYLRALAEAINKRIREISSTIKVLTIDSSLYDFRDGIENIPQLADL